MFEDYFCAYCTLASANRPSHADFPLYKKKNAKPFDLPFLPGVLPPGAASFVIVFV